MRNGISDMHCMSDEYLVQDLLEEMHESKDIMPNNLNPIENGAFVIRMKAPFCG